MFPSSLLSLLLYSNNLIYFNPRRALCCWNKPYGYCKMWHTIQCYMAPAMASSWVCTPAAGGADKSTQGWAEGSREGKEKDIDQGEKEDKLRSGRCGIGGNSITTNILSPFPFLDQTLGPQCHHDIIIVPVVRKHYPFGWLGWSQGSLKGLGLSIFYLLPAP